MKQQFLNDSGLTELIGYIKKYVKDEQDVKPYASLSVFPKTGEQNIIYIDTTVNASYYWDDTSNTYKALDVQTWANLTGKPSTFPPSSNTSICLSISYSIALVMLLNEFIFFISVRVPNGSPGL